MNSGLIDPPSNPFGTAPLDVAPEVRAALAAGRAVVALESTIISHGMPYPQNVATALQVEGEVRAHGAVPATIAVVDGRLKAGLSRAEIEAWAAPGRPCPSSAGATCRWPWRRARPARPRWRRR
jgi:pseudouridine-5'-phosphate glycosidase